jgi:hypothetical protein
MPCPKRAVEQDGPEAGHKVLTQEPTKILARQDPNCSKMDLRELSITSQVVERLLKLSSSVPTMVCFKEWSIFMVSDGQPP